MHLHKGAAGWIWYTACRLDGTSMNDGPSTCLRTYSASWDARPFRRQLENLQIETKALIVRKSIPNDAAPTHACKMANLQTKNKQQISGRRTSCIDLIEFRASFCFAFGDVQLVHRCVLWHLRGGSFRPVERSCKTVWAMRTLI